MIARNAWKDNFLNKPLQDPKSDCTMIRNCMNKPDVEEETRGMEKHTPPNHQSNLMLMVLRRKSYQININIQSQKFYNMAATSGFLSEIGQNL